MPIIVKSQINAELCFLITYFLAELIAMKLSNWHQRLDKNISSLDCIPHIKA